MIFSGDDLKHAVYVLLLIALLIGCGCGIIGTIIYQYMTRSFQ